MVTTLAASMDSIGGQDVNWSCVDQKLDELKVTVLNNYERITRLRMIRVNILVFVLPTIYLAWFKTLLVELLERESNPAI